MKESLGKVNKYKMFRHGTIKKHKRRENYEEK